VDEPPPITPSGTTRFASGLVPVFMLVTLPAVCEVVTVKKTPTSAWPERPPNPLMPVPGHTTLE
jgi:hypothetical protein